MVCSAFSTICNYIIGLPMIIFLPLSVTPTWKCRPFRGLKSVTLLGIIEMVIKFNLVKYK